jgi:hypothetical protein
MTIPQMHLMRRNWEARSDYPHGMRKIDLPSLQAEKQWQNSRHKMIKDAVKSAGNQNLTEPEMQKELQKRRRRE